MFKPVNRYIEIELPEIIPQTASGIVLPADFKPAEERYGLANVISFAKDVRFKEQLKQNSQVIVDKSMIEEITLNKRKINVVLDNYVVGIVK